MSANVYFKSGVWLDCGGDKPQLASEVEIAFMTRIYVDRGTSRPPIYTLGGSVIAPSIMGSEGQSLVQGEEPASG